MNLFDILNLSYKVSAQTVQLLEEVCELRDVKRMECIVNQGKKCNYLYFIADGLFRCGRIENGLETTLMFGFDGDPYTSISTYIAGRPSEFDFQALMNSKVYAVSFNNWHRLLRECADLSEWWTDALAQQIFVLEQRYVYFTTYDAETRYRRLVGDKIREKLIQNAPLKYIAQYLGVTQETLSRIRSKIARNAVPAPSSHTRVKYISPDSHING